jgi:hypothetical protein
MKEKEKMMQALKLVNKIQKLKKKNMVGSVLEQFLD